MISQSLQQDIERIAAEPPVPVDDTAGLLRLEVRRFGVRFVVDARPGQTEAEVTAIARRVFDQFTVEPLFPSPPFKPIPSGEFGHDSYVVVLRPAGGMSFDDVTQNPFDIAHALQAEGGFVRVEPDIVGVGALPEQEPVEPDGADAQQVENKAWALKAMKVKEAWEATGNNRGLNRAIASLDTGWAEHEEFKAPAISNGWNYVENHPKGQEDARDPLNATYGGHGTATASVIVARGGIQDGYRGTLPPGEVTGVATAAWLYVVRATTSVIVWPNTELTRSIEWAIQKGCHVITMSLGFWPHSSVGREIEKAVRKNRIVVAAAGNSSLVTVYPAAWDSCIAVGASTVKGQMWHGSNYAPCGSVDILAPGEWIWRALRKSPNDSSKAWVEKSYGTSYATALIAGVAALWHAKWRNADHTGSPNAQAQFRAHMKATATATPGEYHCLKRDRKHPDRRIAGMVNAHRLVTETPPRGPFKPTSLEPYRAIVASLVGAESEHHAVAMLSEVLGGDPSAPFDDANLEVIESVGFELATILMGDAQIRAAVGECMTRFPSTEAQATDSAQRGDAAARIRTQLADKASNRLRGYLTASPG